MYHDWNFIRSVLTFLRNITKFSTNHHESSKKHLKKVQRGENKWSFVSNPFFFRLYEGYGQAFYKIYYQAMHDLE